MSFKDKALALFRGNGKAHRQQELKERVLRNREGLLDAMAQNIKGARQCPFLLGAKCIGILCEHFMEWKTINNETKKEAVYRRCAHMQMPLLMCELLRDINLLRKEIAK